MMKQIMEKENKENQNLEDKKEILREKEEKKGEKKIVRNILK
jgi:hypothetical protein